MNEYLGRNVVDTITGFTGVVTQIIQKSTGNFQCAVHPKTDDPSKYPEGMVIDTMSLHFVDDEAANVVDVPYPSLIQIGDQVKDKVVGIKGIVVEKSTHINGCEMFLIEGKYNKKTGKCSIDWINSVRLEIVQKQKVRLIPDVLKQMEPAARPGGPGSRITAKVAPRV